MSPGMVVELFVIEIFMTSLGIVYLCNTKMKNCKFDRESSQNLTMKVLIVHLDEEQALSSQWGKNDNKNNRKLLQRKQIDSI